MCKTLCVQLDAFRILKQLLVVRWLYSSTCAWSCVVYISLWWCRQPRLSFLWYCRWFLVLLREDALTCTVSLWTIWYVCVIYDSQHALFCRGWKLCVQLLCRELTEFCLCRGSSVDRPVVQPVARHYTDWATPAHEIYYWI
jgi:hypothetical protein